jgi:hypothetical protein
MAAYLIGIVRPSAERGYFMGWVLLDVVIPVFTLVLLALCWQNRDVRVHTKVVLTVLYLASWGVLVYLLLFQKEWSQLFIALQFVLLMATGGITGGWEFLKGSR